MVNLPSGNTQDDNAANKLRGHSSGDSEGYFELDDGVEGVNGMLTKDGVPLVPGTTTRLLTGESLVWHPAAIAANE
jgi:hypothetical protein